MKVISILNQKGGVGKTTMATGIAAALAEAGHKVLLVDADNQGSSLQWQAARSLDPLFSVVGIAHEKIHLDIKRFQADYDYIIIDGSPRVTGVAKSAIAASDLTVIPVQPSPYDIWSSEEIVSLCKEMQIYRPEFKAAFCINRVIPNTVIGRGVEDALEQFGMPVLKSVVVQRVIYAEAAASGMTLSEADKAGKVAANEMQRLTQEILVFGTNQTQLGGQQ